MSVIAKQSDTNAVTANTFCTYVDILGDRTKHLAFDNSPEQLEVLDQWKNRIVQMTVFKGLNEFAVNNKFWSFSDSFIYADYKEYMELQQQHYADMISNAVKRNVQISISLMLSGWCMRGGIDYGLCLVDDSGLIGRPLIGAYLLESNVSIYPCTTLSKNSELAIAEHVNGTKHPDWLEVQKMLIRRKCDYRAIVNPFANESLKFYHRNSNGTLKVSRLRSYIIEQLSQHEFEPRLYEKYAFLRDLFNYSIGSDFGINKIPVSGEETQKFVAY